ncbi:MAG: helix-turn-helix domain-containing protein [Balneolaceae bacterium]
MPLGKDLAYIRKSQNLTLEDIQSAIKIPVHTLKSIEDGSIFHANAENQTYRRSFIRSYAKVLKIPDEEIVQALDAMEAGTYHGDLLSESDQGIAESDAEEIESAEENEDQDVETSAEAPLIPEKPKPNQPPDVHSINWADMGRKFSPAGRNSKAVLLVIIFVSVSILAGAGYFFSDQIAGIFGSDVTPTDQLQATSGEPDVVLAPIDSVGIPQNLEEISPDNTSADSESETQNEPITLSETITVAVYAAYGQLEPIRVTSDLNWRTNPYWMEEGEAYNFDFRDTLLVRGQYSRMLLLFNGHPIDNPRQNHYDSSFNSVMITRSDLNQPQYLASPPQEFPLEVGEPDSLVYRIRF